MSISKEKLLERAKEHIGTEKYNSKGYLMKCVEYNKSSDIIVEFQDEFHARVPSRWDIFMLGLIRNPNEGKERVGTKIDNTLGYSMECVEYNSSTDIKVEFLDDFHAVVSTNWASFISGNVGNPNTYKERIGMIGYNTKNEKMIVTDYHSSTDVEVEFQDEFKMIKHTSWANFNNGQVSNPHDNEIEDLSGKIYGSWHVIKQVEDYISPQGYHIRAWQCWCDCEKDFPFGNRNKYSITENRLINSQSVCCRNCGAKKRGEKMKTYHMKNRSIYDLTGEYGVGHTYDNNVFYFDLEDYDKIKNYNWFVNDQDYLLARINLDNGKNKYIRMHRVIMDVLNDNTFEVDHIHGIKSRNDNRKSNLRLATHTQNNINKDKPKNNTSGVKGVSWSKTMNKWRVRIAVNKKEKELGFFDDFNEAVKVRKQAEDKYFGEWSYDNSMKKGENNG